MRVRYREGGGGRHTTREGPEAATWACHCPSAAGSGAAGRSSWPARVGSPEEGQRAGRSWPDQACAAVCCWRRSGGGDGTCPQCCWSGAA